MWRSRLIHISRPRCRLECPIRYWAAIGSRSFRESSSVSCALLPPRVSCVARALPREMLHEAISRYRTPDEIALDLVAALLLEQGQVRFGLHAFRNYSQTKRMSHGDDR